MPPQYMKKVFEKWKSTSQNSLGDAIERWLYTRTSAIKDGENNNQIICVFLAELAIRVADEDPNLAPLVLDKIFNTPRLGGKFPQAIASHIVSRCKADDNWGVLPIVLHTFSADDHFIPRYDTALIDASGFIMQGPDKFRSISEHFDSHAKKVLLPYCIARDPYNAQFVSEEWEIPLSPECLFKSVVIATQGLSNFENLSDLKPIAPLITVSDIFEQLKTRKNLPEEFFVLGAAIKNMKGENLNIDVNKCSWVLKKNQNLMLEKWMKLLSFASPCATAHDHYILQKMDEFSSPHNISFAALSSQMQKSVIQEGLGESLSKTSSQLRVQRKL